MEPLNTLNRRLTDSLYLRRFLREVTSRTRPSLASEASSSSLCSFLRDALALVASSSASSNWRFSCFIRELTFSIWKKEGHKGEQVETERSRTVGRWILHSKSESLHACPYLLLVLVGMTTLIVHLHHDFFQFLLCTTDGFVGCCFFPGSLTEKKWTHLDLMFRQTFYNIIYLYNIL